MNSQSYSNYISNNTSTISSAQESIGNNPSTTSTSYANHYHYAKDLQRKKIRRIYASNEMCNEVVDNIDIMDDASPFITVNTNNFSSCCNCCSCISFNRKMMITDNIPRAHENITRNKPVKRVARRRRGHVPKVNSKYEDIIQTAQNIKSAPCLCKLALKHGRNGFLIRNKETRNSSRKHSFTGCFKSNNGSKISYINSKEKKLPFTVSSLCCKINQDSLSLLRTKDSENYSKKCRGHESETRIPRIRHSQKKKKHVRCNFYETGETAGSKSASIIVSKLQSSTIEIKFNPLVKVKSKLKREEVKINDKCGLKQNEFMLNSLDKVPGKNKIVPIPTGPRDSVASYNSYELNESNAVLQSSKRQTLDQSARNLNDKKKKTRLQKCKQNKNNTLEPNVKKNIFSNVMKTCMCSLKPTNIFRNKKPAENEYVFNGCRKHYMASYEHGSSFCVPGFGDPYNYYKGNKAEEISLRYDPLVSRIKRYTRSELSLLSCKCPVRIKQSCNVQQILLERYTKEQKKSGEPVDICSDFGYKIFVHNENSDRSIKNEHEVLSSTSKGLSTNMIYKQFGPKRNLQATHIVTNEKAHYSKRLLKKRFCGNISEHKILRIQAVPTKNDQSESRFSKLRSNKLKPETLMKSIFRAARKVSKKDPYVLDRTTNNILNSHDSQILKRVIPTISNHKHFIANNCYDYKLANNDEIPRIAFPKCKQTKYPVYYFNCEKQIESNPYYRSYYALNFKMSQVRKKHISIIKDREYKPGIHVPNKSDPEELLGQFRLKSSISTKTENSQSKNSSIITKSSMQKPPVKYFSKTNKHSGLKTFHRPRCVTRFGSNVKIKMTFSRHADKTVSPTTNNSTFNVPPHKKMHEKKKRDYNLRPLSKRVSLSPAYSLPQPHKSSYADKPKYNLQDHNLVHVKLKPSTSLVKKGLRKFRQNKKSNTSFKTKLNDLAEYEKSGVTHNENQVGIIDKQETLNTSQDVKKCSQKNVSIQSNTIPRPKLLSKSTNLKTSRKIDNVWTDIASRTTHFKTPKVANDMSNIIAKSSRRLGYRFGSHVNFIMQFSKEADNHFSRSIKRNKEKKHSNDTSIQITSKSAQEKSPSIIQKITRCFCTSSINSGNKKKDLGFRKSHDHGEDKGILVQIPSKQESLNITHKIPENISKYVKKDPENLTKCRSIRPGQFSECACKYTKVIPDCACKKNVKQSKCKYPEKCSKCKKKQKKYRKNVSKCGCEIRKEDIECVYPKKCPKCSKTYPDHFFKCACRYPDMSECECISTYKDNDESSVKENSIARKSKQDKFKIFIDKKPSRKITTLINNKNESVNDEIELTEQRVHDLDKIEKSQGDPLKQRRFRTKSTKANNNNLSVKSTVINYDKSTITKKKRLTKSFNECEPHVCTPGVCDPRVCFKIMKGKKKLVKHKSISTTNKVKEKSVATCSCDKKTSIVKRCFCILTLKNEYTKDIERKLNDNVNGEKRKKRKEKSSTVGHATTLSTFKKNSYEQQNSRTIPNKKVMKHWRHYFFCDKIGKLGFIKLKPQNRKSVIPKPDINQIKPSSAKHEKMSGYKTKEKNMANEFDYSNNAIAERNEQTQQRILDEHEDNNSLSPKELVCSSQAKSILLNEANLLLGSKGSEMTKSMKVAHKKNKEIKSTSKDPRTVVFCPCCTKSVSNHLINKTFKKRSKTSNNSAFKNQNKIKKYSSKFESCNCTLPHGSISNTILKPRGDINKSELEINNQKHNFPEVVKHVVACPCCTKTKIEPESRSVAKKTNKRNRQKSANPINKKKKWNLRNICECPKDDSDTSCKSRADVTGSLAKSQIGASPTLAIQARINSECSQLACQEKISKQECTAFDVRNIFRKKSRNKYKLQNVCKCPEKISGFNTFLDSKSLVLTTGVRKLKSTNGRETVQYTADFSSPNINCTKLQIKNESVSVNPDSTHICFCPEQDLRKDSVAHKSKSKSDKLSRSFFKRPEHKTSGFNVLKPKLDVNYSQPSTICPCCFKGQITSFISDVNQNGRVNLYHARQASRKADKHSAHHNICECSQYTTRKDILLKHTSLTSTTSAKHKSNNKDKNLEQFNNSDSRIGTTCPVCAKTQIKSKPITAVSDVSLDIYKSQQPCTSCKHKKTKYKLPKQDISHKSYRKSNNERVSRKKIENLEFVAGDSKRLKNTERIETTEFSPNTCPCCTEAQLKPETISNNLPTGNISCKCRQKIYNENLDYEAKPRKPNSFTLSIAKRKSEKRNKNETLSKCLCPQHKSDNKYSTLKNKQTPTDEDLKHIVSLTKGKYENGVLLAQTPSEICPCCAKTCIKSEAVSAVIGAVNNICECHQDSNDYIDLHSRDNQSRNSTPVSIIDRSGYRPKKGTGDGPYPNCKCIQHLSTSKDVNNEDKPKNRNHLTLSAIKCRSEEKTKKEIPVVCKCPQDVDNFKDVISKSKTELTKKTKKHIACDTKRKYKNDIPIAKTPVEICPCCAKFKPKTESVINEATNNICKCSSKDNDEYLKPKEKLSKQYATFLSFMSSYRCKSKKDTGKGTRNVCKCRQHFSESIHLNSKNEQIDGSIIENINYVSDSKYLKGKNKNDELNFQTPLNVCPCSAKIEIKSEPVLSVMPTANNICECSLPVRTQSKQGNFLFSVINRKRRNSRKKKVHSSHPDEHSKSMNSKDEQKVRSQIRKRVQNIQSNSQIQICTFCTSNQSKSKGVSDYTSDIINICECGQEASNNRYLKSSQKQNKSSTFPTSILSRFTRQSKYKTESRPLSVCKCYEQNSVYINGLPEYLDTDSKYLKHKNKDDNLTSQHPFGVCPCCAKAQEKPKTTKTINDLIKKNVCECPQEAYENNKYQKFEHKRGKHDPKITGTEKMPQSVCECPPGSDPKHIKRKNDIMMSQPQSEICPCCNRIQARPETKPAIIGAVTNNTNRKTNSKNLSHRKSEAKRNKDVPPQSKTAESVGGTCNVCTYQQDVLSKYMKFADGKDTGLSLETPRSVAYCLCSDDKPEPLLNTVNTQFGFLQYLFKKRSEKEHSKKKDDENKESVPSVASPLAPTPPAPPPPPIISMVVDAKTMKVTNKAEIFKSLKADMKPKSVKKGPQAVKNTQILSPVIDLVINKENANILNSNEMIRTLDPSLIIKKKKRLSSKRTKRQKLPVKGVTNVPPFEHPKDCTCCACTNNKGERKRGHPKNCTCCFCRYGCRYGTKTRLKEDEKNNEKDDKKSKATREGILVIGDVDLGNIAHKIAIRTATNVKDYAKTLIDKKPCFCGHKICESETKLLRENDQNILRQKFLYKKEIPQPCVCGSVICKRKYESKSPYFSEQHKLDMEREKIKSKGHKKLKKNAKQMLKEYNKEYDMMRQRVKTQDKIAMQHVKKYSNADSCILLAESAADIGRLGINTTRRMVTGLRRSILHPAVTLYRIRMALRHPKVAYKNWVKTCKASGYSGTAARVKRRCASMQTSQYLVSALESHPLTNYMYHLRDKDPKKRLTRITPQKETRDFECSPYMASLRKRPCLWLYYLCPWFYPHCLGILAAWRQFTDIILFILAVGVWSPCILCTEFCRTVLCCLMCAGGG